MTGSNLDSPSPLPEDDSAPDDVTVGAGLDFSDPNSPLAPYFMRLSQLIAVALLLAVFFWLNVVPLWHSDVWGHLLFGQRIVTDQALPLYEPFCRFSASDQPVAHFQWLAQAIYYQVFCVGEWMAGGDPMRQLAGGASALRFLHAVLGLLEWMALLAAYRRVCGSLPVACAGLVVLALMRLGTADIQRPQAFGTLFFAILLFLLVKQPLTRRALMLAPLVLVAWANTHGSFLVGLILIGVFAAGRLWELVTLQGWRAIFSCLNDPGFFRLTLLGLLGLAAVALANPQGPSLLLDAVGLARHPNFVFLGEWAPLNFSLPEGGHRLYLAMLVVLVASLALSPASLSPSGILILFSFGVLPLFQQRMMVWWLLLWPILVLPLWRAWGTRFLTPHVRLETAPNFRITLLTVFLVILASLWTIPVQWLFARRPQGLDMSLSKPTPWKLARALEQPDDKAASDYQPIARLIQAKYGGRFRGTIFAEATLADFLIWKLDEDHPVVVYSHVHLFPAEHWRDYITALEAQPGWTEVLDRLRVNLVVIQPALSPALAEKLRQDSRWLVVEPASAKADTALLIAVRRSPK